MLGAKSRPRTPPVKSPVQNPGPEEAGAAEYVELMKGTPIPPTPGALGYAPYALFKLGYPGNTAELVE